MVTETYNTPNAIPNSLNPLMFSHSVELFVVSHTIKPFELSIEHVRSITVSHIREINKKHAIRTGITNIFSCSHTNKTYVTFVCDHHQIPFRFGPCVITNHSDDEFWNEKQNRKIELLTSIDQLW